jgi:hypothetical protein
MEISPAFRRIFAWEVFYSTSYDTGARRLCGGQDAISPIRQKRIVKTVTSFVLTPDFCPHLVPGEEIHEFQTESLCCCNIEISKKPDAIILDG